MLAPGDKVREDLRLPALGGILGVGLGLSIAGLLKLGLPGLPVETPIEYVAAALAVSLIVGLTSGDCSCASGVPTAGWLALLPLLLIRRRRTV